MSSFLSNIIIGWISGSMVSYLFYRNKKKPKFVSIPSFEWFDPKIKPIPKDKQRILVFVDEDYYDPYLKIWIARSPIVSFSDKGEPLYIESKIVKWAYLPYPAEEK